jgi:hypothetical protein
MIHPGNRIRAPALAAAALAVLFALAGCGGGSGGAGGGTPLPTPTVSMNLPDSLTGGTSVAVTASARRPVAAGDFNCNYLGAGSDDPFQNGYFMTKFLVGVVASWQCITDSVLTVVAQSGNLATGQIYTITDSAGGTEPTAFSITRDSDTQTTVRLYYSGNVTTPGLFLSWNTVGSDTTGKLVLSPLATQLSTGDEPSNTRMDFTTSATQRTADMFIRFGSNPVIDGFRIEVAENLAGDDPRFIARGLLDTFAQWDTDYRNGPGGPGPALSMYAMANAAGNGAAAAIFSNVGFGMDFALWGIGSGHFGYYQYQKDDRYFFDSSSGWDWVDKTITSATYQGGRNSPVPDETAVETAVGLTAGYFSGHPCATAGDDCTEFIQALHTAAGGGWSGQEPNQGFDPVDWRSTLMGTIDGTDMLTTVYPDGLSNWTGAFAMSFTP